MLDVALEVFRKRFVALVGTAFVLMAAAQVLQLWLQQRSEELLDRGDEETAILIAALQLPLVFLVSLFVAAATSRLAYSTLEGRPISVWASLAFVCRRLPYLLAAALLEFCALMLGFFACIVPMFFLAWKFALASTAVVL